MEIDKLQLERSNGRLLSSSAKIKSFNFRIWTLEIEGKIDLVEYAKRPDDSWGLIKRLGPWAG